MPIDPGCLSSQVLFRVLGCRFVVWISPKFETSTLIFFAANLARLQDDSHHQPRFDPTLDLPVRRLTEPRVKYLSVSRIQEAGHWRPHHGARTPPVTARRRVAPDTPSRLQSRLQSRAGPKQVRATPSQHTLTLIFGSTRGCGPCDPPLARRAGCTHHRPTHPPGHEVEGAESCDMTAAADRGAGARISRINPRASRNPRIRSPAATRGSRLARLAKS